MKTTRTAGISSTTIGYDYKRVTRGEDETGHIIVRDWRNISAASMKRFYRFSKGAMLVLTKREISWLRYHNLFYWLEKGKAE
jgi:hypothetical protein